MTVTPPRLLINRIPIISSWESVLEVLVFLTEDDLAVGGKSSVDFVLSYFIIFIPTTYVATTEIATPMIWFCDV